MCCCSRAHCGFGIRISGIRILSVADSPLDCADADIADVVAAASARWHYSPSPGHASRRAAHHRNIYPFIGGYSIR